MVDIYTPGSFTKNFSWNLSYRRLYDAIRGGFSGAPRPVSRERWRADSGIADANRQLIPMNFFLYSMEGVAEDFLLVDQFVESALERRYNGEFCQFALFNFHQANSGHWRNSPWRDGRVAGWANDYIREIASVKGVWPATSFDERSLADFLDERIVGEARTKHKMLTNYRYMLESAGVLVDGKLQPEDLRQRWLVDAVQLFWDRQIFDGALPATPRISALEDVLMDHEVFKLLRCDKNQCRAFARAAYAEFSRGQGPARVAQIDGLRARDLVGS
jgi:hypothetical protein